jgi:hypothetical protein
LDEILANENTDAPAVVTIMPTDRGFKSSGCGNWTTDLSAITSNRKSIGDGIFIVGTDIESGTFQTSGGSGCYFARLSGFGGSLDEILANENTDAPAVVTIMPTDRGFKSNRCGVWTEVETGTTEHSARSDEQFQYTKYPNGYRADEFCDKPKIFGEKRFCYPYDWKPWLKELEQRTAGNYAGAISGDSGTQTPGNLVLSWNGEGRVVFGGCRPHDCPTAKAYFIVTPSTKELDIIWQNESGIKYFGPHSDFLRTNSAFEILDKNW